MPVVWKHNNSNDNNDKNYNNDDDDDDNKWKLFSLNLAKPGKKRLIILYISFWILSH